MLTGKAHATAGFEAGEGQAVGIQGGRADSQETRMDRVGCGSLRWARRRGFVRNDCSGFSRRQSCELQVGRLKAVGKFLQFGFKLGDLAAFEHADLAAWEVAGLGEAPCE